MARELMGNLMASRFGLNTPPVAIVEISPKAFQGVKAWCEAKKQFCPFHAGIAVGCLKMPIQSSFRPTLPLKQELVHDVLEMFVFDVLTKYADRTEDNPNCALVSGKSGSKSLSLLVFDFEQLFSTDRLLELEKANPYSLLATLHCCRSLLMGEGGRVQSFRDRILELQSVDWSQVISSLPHNWRKEAKIVVDLVVKTNVDELLSTVSTMLGQK